MKCLVRFRINSNGAQWFNPVNRKWLPLDIRAMANIEQILQGLTQ
jgi:hypothetical protein